MKINPKDFEFYTFFLGLKQSELKEIKKLLESFPYYDSHKLNIIDKSEAIKKQINSKEKKLYLTWRSYKINPESDLNYDEYSQLLVEYKDKINVIKESKPYFHGQSMDNVISKYSKAAYVVIMDSDIVFISDKYLSDMLELCNQHDYDELASIGTLFQNAPFHLTLNEEFPSSFFSLFLKGSKDKINLKSIMGLQKSLFKLSFNRYLKRKGMIKRDKFLGRFPRLHPALLIVNTKIFKTYNMCFQNLYLDVLEKKKDNLSKHRILGDNGASFLYQCSLAGKKIVNIDFEEYVLHMARASTIDKKKTKGWSWFNEELTDDIAD
jgi:hypothetical protein